MQREWGDTAKGCHRGRPRIRSSRCGPSVLLPSNFFDSVVEVTSQSVKWLETQFLARYQAEKERLEALRASDLEASAKEQAHQLDRIAKEGLAQVLSRRPKSGQKLLDLVADFVELGSMAILSTGSQRAGDFLNNQLRGRWAERVVASMPLPDLEIIPYGPSGAAMPGEENHRRIVATFGLIHHLEGKRPDLLAFDAAYWHALDPELSARAMTWPERPLDPVDVHVLSEAKFAIEVKSSTWHYAKRRAAGKGPLAITVKDEELATLSLWADRTGVPVLFIQVLFDELYCMSYRRMLAGRDRGYVYQDGDYTLDRARDSDKFVHRFFVDGAPHLCGEVAFPSASTAEVQILGDGSVVPYINLAPAAVISVKPAVIDAEVSYPN